MCLCCAGTGLAKGGAYTSKTVTSYSHLSPAHPSACSPDVPQEVSLIGFVACTCSGLCIMQQAAVSCKAFYAYHPRLCFPDRCIAGGFNQKVTSVSDAVVPQLSEWKRGTDAVCPWCTKWLCCDAFLRAFPTLELEVRADSLQQFDSSFSQHIFS